MIETHYVLIQGGFGLRAKHQSTSNDLTQGATQSSLCNLPNG